MRLCCGLLMALLTVACAPLGDPTVVGPGPTGELGPPWLPTGWVKADPPPILPSDQRFHVYAPPGAAAPFVAVARFTPEETTTLAGRTGGDAYAWLTKGINDSLEAGGLTLEESRPWSRPDLRQGCARHFAAFWQERERGLLAGRVAVGQGQDGSLLLVVAAVPKGDDETLVEQLLQSVPVTDSGPEELQSEAVEHNADGT